MNTRKIQGFDGWWEFFRDHFSDLHLADPGNLSASRYFSAILSDVVIPHSSEAPQLGGETKGKGQRKGGNVLFLPNVATSYCLGSCLKIAEELVRVDPGRKVFFLKSFNTDPTTLLNFEVIDWSASLKSSLHGLFSRAPNGSFGKAYFRRLLSIPECRAGFRQLWGSLWKIKIRSWIWRLGREISLARSLLECHGIGLVITVNDVVKPSAAFVSAARQMGLHTILLQHGTPGPHNVPYAASEYWSWGPSSTKMLTDLGADSSTIFNLGNLEMELNRTEIVTVREETPPRLLILLQWTGAAAWNELVFKEIVLHAAKALEEVSPEWVLHIRTHPKDRPEVIRDCRDTIANYMRESRIRYEYSEEGASVEQDVMRASCVVTVNSSAMAHAICLEKPHLQYLPEHLESRIGTAFVSRTNIVRDQEQFTSWLRKVIEGSSPSCEAIEEAIANYGSAVEVAARRVGSLLGPKASNPSMDKPPSSS